MPAALLPRDDVVERIQNVFREYGFAERRSRKYRKRRVWEDVVTATIYRAVKTKWALPYSSGSTRG